MLVRSWRAVLVMLLLGIVVWGTTEATLQALRAVPVARRDSSAALVALPARLTQHLLLVVVDGLRWDVANDRRIMPRFARAMIERTSGEIWASPISMTSSAVLAYGTGERGGLDQVLENLHLPPAHVNSWLRNAHDAGLRLMAAGDGAWSQLYGEYLTEFRPDPAGVAIDADFNARTFRNARELQEKAPDVLVAHFVTPDHQGHAYGIRSERYAAHMRAFDREMFEWLDRVPRVWTIIVTSDHGAADSGTHGTDTMVQRRCPIFALGPGISDRVHLQRALDQVELPGLFAALLGVANAEQSRGVALLDWLDVPQATRQRLACTEVARIARVDGARLPSGSIPGSATAQACCKTSGSEKDCVPEARQLAAAYDQSVGQSRGIHSRHAWPWIVAVVTAALSAAVLLLGRGALAVVAFGSLWLTISLALTVYVERLPGGSPNLVRAVLFALTNGLLLVGVFNVNRWARWLQRHAAWTLSIVPGWLLVSFTTNTQVEVYVAVVVLGVACSWSVLIAPFVPGLVRRVSHGTVVSERATAVVMIVSLLLLAMAGTRPSDIFPAFFCSSAVGGAVLAAALVLAGFTWLLQPSTAAAIDPGRAIEPASGNPSRWITSTCFKLGVILFSFALRHVALHWMGRALLLASILGLLLCLYYRRGELAIFLGVVSYTWISRDCEWLIVVPALIAADIFGRVSTWGNAAAHIPRIVWLAGHVTLLFALGMLLRIGLQGGLQLETLDLTVGTFGDAALPLWLSGACLSYKFLAAELLMLGIYLRHFPPVDWAPLLLGLAMAYLARVLSLLLMLFVCGGSYWTAFRVVADLPFAVVGLVGVGLVGGAWLLRQPQAARCESLE